MSRPLTKSPGKRPPRCAPTSGELDAAAAAAAEVGRGESTGCQAARPWLSSSAAPTPDRAFPPDQPSPTGRHPGSDIVLDDVTVSRRHAEFRLENGEFWIVDIGSLNGTYLNRKPVQSAALANGDEIQIGKYRLVFLTRPTTG